MHFVGNIIAVIKDSTRAEPCCAPLCLVACRIQLSVLMPSLLHGSGAESGTRAASHGSQVAEGVAERVDISARLDMEPLPHDVTPDQRLLTGRPSIAHVRHCDKTATVSLAEAAQPTWSL